VVRARQFPPYSRAAATAFHRLPVHGVSVNVNGARSRRISPTANAAETSSVANQIRFQNLKSQIPNSRYEIPIFRFHFSDF
jgi:hypothetical protein